jgi:hypothetical protein
MQKLLDLLRQHTRPVRPSRTLRRWRAHFRCSRRAIDCRRRSTR